ncbi:hypothetical protein [Vibrio rumoiensis]|uniref:Uncharacterized protein n=1 Tax=Vibrio rumoiensis 1S-45 TaxID=1188252 RepID=A0A1E5DZ78_9VIBR|nr:hypothetical protein [Vibrio rumoiensis]OEF23152.1 hypothetical protein A1QC_02795 [Vibrio rumoiensis 1S-45]
MQDNQSYSKGIDFDSLVEKIVELTPIQLEKLNHFIDDMLQIDDFSSPILSEQEKQTLSKMLKI